MNRVFGLLLAVLLPCCFASAPDGRCKKTQDCYAGDVCLEGRCHTLCTTQSNCSGDTYCDVDGMCRPRVNDGPTPRIDAIVGNAAGDTTRIADGIVVSGENLEAAAVELISTSGAVGLEARSRSATRVELALPAEIVSGEYTLTATNAAGSAAQALTLTLPEVTPEQVLEKLNAASGVVSQARLPESLVTEAELLSAHGDPSCPAGYLRDTARTDIVLCKRGADEMVRVGDVWVDRYEATVWSSPDCTGTSHGQEGDDYGPSFPDSGAVGGSAGRLYACSVAGELPSGFATQLQAQQACAASGKRLITNDVWQTAAASTFDPGSYDGHTGSLCNTTSSLGKRVTGAGASTVSSPGCESLYGAQDLVGNPSGFGNDSTWGVDGRAWDNAAWVPGLPAAAIRGGCWAYGADSGVFSLRVYSSPAGSNGCIGFRCMRAR